MINVKKSTHFYIQENIKNTPTSNFYILEGNLKNKNTVDIFIYKKIMKIHQHRAFIYKKKIVNRKNVETMEKRGNPSTSICALNICEIVNRQ